VEVLDERSVVEGLDAVIARPADRHADEVPVGAGEVRPLAAEERGGLQEPSCRGRHQ